MTFKIFLCQFYILILMQIVIYGQDEVTLIIDNSIKTHKANLKEMNNWLRESGNISKEDRNKNWIIEIKEGLYSNSDWHNIIWGDRISNPNEGYTLTIKPELNASVTIKGGNDVERAFKIGSETSGLIIENITFDGFYRLQVLMYKSSNCTIKNCIFQNMNREGAWAAISVQDCEGNYNNNTIENNTFRNLSSPGIGLHTVYLTRSDDTQIRNNTVFYCSGGVFKCVDGSDNNKFDGNTIYDGCGDHAYFIARNGSGQTKLSTGNVVTNTNCLLSEGYKESNVYDNSAYKYVRMFVYNKAGWPFEEYEWPDNYDDQHDSSQPFYIPKGHKGNNFNQIRSAFDVNIDDIIDEDPAYIYLSSNPIGNANNPLHRAKYEFDPGGADLIVFPYYYTVRNSNNRYLNYFRINDLSRKPRSFHVKFKLRTCEGEIINKGDLEYRDGVIELEKWIIERIDSSGWVTDIQGSDQTINFSNSNNIIMELYTSDNNFLIAGSIFEYRLLEGINYNLYVKNSTKVTLRPQEVQTSTNQSGSIDKLIPKEILLFQNYPNPFNPSTNIHFELLKLSYVELVVFDIQGQELEVLFAGMLPRGHHTYNWTPKNISSGVYYYRLKFDKGLTTKKMIFLR
ncbi:MAG: right-handed parallel beta-helix repeat-containing protein [Melioribacteraceae bacterium]|nr:right-handed parallel beta-helix repeat-containing protein [Melioribacteraceae bacterium]